MKLSRRLPILLACITALLAAGGAVYAQLEGADRGVPPIDSASTFEVTGIEVDVTADSPERAREEGWRQAQALGWKALWASTHKRPQSQAPNLSESVLSGMVSGVVIENEQIGPKRYIATLGMLFDRARTGQLLGVSGLMRRSAPLLVLPVVVTGSTPYSFEFRNEWQRAWARFRTQNSPIDYVRVTGGGIDPMLLNIAQARRPGRNWWRMLLDQYGAADVIIPEVNLRRMYPGGPAIGTFTARQGPDNRVLDRIVLRVESSAGIPRMLDEGVRRLDRVYARALEAGMLTPDPSLQIIEIPIPNEVEEAAEERPERDTSPADVRPSTADTPVPTGSASVITIQVDTPTAGAVQQAEVAVSRVGGVTSALTTSLAIGGTSVMRVTFSGDPAALASALQSRGWSVSGSGSSLRISRPGE